MQSVDKRTWVNLLQDSDSMTRFHLYKSSDAGNTWKQILELKNDSYVRIACNAKTWFVMSQSYVLVSVDQGDNWTYYPGGIGTSLRETKFCFLDDNKLLAMGSNRSLIIKLK